MSTEGTPAAMPSDAELFRSSVEAPAPSPAADSAPSSPEPATPSSPPSPTEQPRGPDGRWIPGSEPPPAQQVQPPDAPVPGQPAPEDPMVPSGRFREIREDFERRQQAYEARQRELEMHLYELRRQNEQLQTQLKPPPAPEIPDVITDPAAYHKFVTEQHDRKMRDLEANFSFRMAHREHGDAFEQAYSAMLHRAQQGDPSVVRQVMSSGDPGAAMMNWFRRERTLQMVGDEPEKWFMARLHEIAKDPKVSGELLELIRSQAPAAQPNGAPNVQLPPSLNRVAASAPNVAGVNGMPSDKELFDHAFRQGR